MQVNITTCMIREKYSNNHGGSLSYAHFSTFYRGKIVEEQFTGLLNKESF